MRPAETSIVHFTSQVGISIVGFLATVYFARELGAATYGTFVVVLALLYWASIPSNAIGSAITKRVSEKEDPGSFLSAGFLLTTAIAIILVIAAVLLREPLQGYIGAPVIDLFVLLLIGQSAFSLTKAGLNGQQMVAYTGGLQLSERVFRVIVQVSLILLMYGLSGVIAGRAISTLVASIVGVLLFTVNFQRPRREHIDQLIAYARYSWAGLLKSRILGPSIDVLVLQVFIGSALVGIYQVSWNIASILVLASTSIQQTLFPEISELATRDDYEKIHELLSEALLFTGIFAIPGFLGAVVLAPQILDIYGEAFRMGQVILLVLIVARIVASYSSQLSSAINALDHPDIAMRINLVFMGLNVVLDVLFIPLFGWYGAAGATTLAAVTALVLNYRALTERIGRLSIPGWEIGKQLFAGIVMLLVVTTLKTLVPTRSDYVTIVLVLVGALVYGVTLFAASRWVRRKTISLLPITVS